MVTGSAVVIKGALIGAVIGACTDAIANAFSVTKGIINTLKRRSLAAAGLLSAQEVQQAELQADLRRLMEVALDCPQQLLNERNGPTLMRVLRHTQELHGTGDLPWQVVLIHQRLDTVIEGMPYDDLYALFGGRPTPAALPAASIKALPKKRYRSSQLKVGLGSAQHRSCPICLQDFKTSDKLCLLPGCQHAYHGGCVGKWLKVRGDCPVCRRLVSAS